MPEFPQILVFAAPFFAVSVAIEWILVHRRKANGAYEIKDAFASISMGLGNLISDIFFGFISLGFLFLIWEYRLFDWGYSIWAVLAALICQDFVYYWKHLISHKVRWFWSAHIVHHSSEHYNLSTALRQPWNGHLTGLVVFSAPLVWLGIHPLLLAFVGSLNLLYQFWIHTEAINKMPRWFEAVFNSPSHHRVHHGTNPRYLDSNFAGILIIWDRLFGTFVPEQDSEQITYGVIKPVETFNPVKIAFAEMFHVFKDCTKRGLTLGQRAGYIFGPPGFSHDGSRKSSHVIKQDYVRDYPDQAGTPGLREHRSIFD
jgi:sterol desaturase/sphingolipid hydroxylase (fatty acid hydroxylase superfamily)